MYPTLGEEIERAKAQGTYTRLKLKFGGRTCSLASLANAIQRAYFHTTKFLEPSPDLGV